MSRILLGVSGGIAAYKALEFVRLATGEGHAVRVIQTPAAQRFVGAASFVGLTGAPVLTDEFEPDATRGAFPGDRPPLHAPLSHLALVDAADVYLIAPATANTLAKLAHGHADNLLSSAALAARCPLILAPAMNNQMWQHAATQANVALLRERGATVLEPGVGRLGSEGEWGPGRLPEPALLLEACTGAAIRPWSSLKVLVSAGGTREAIDAVRYVGNRSSGRMGLALAAEAASRGAEVVLVAANVMLATPPRVRLIAVESAAQLQQACEDEFNTTDVLLMAAAVADFRPRDPAQGKLAKSFRADLTLTMEKTTDVLAQLSARRRPEQTIVGFAAEHGEGALERAREKLERKSLDAVIVNDVSVPGIGFDSAENEVAIVTKDGVSDVPRADKRFIAGAVLDAVDRLRQEE